MSKTFEHLRERITANNTIDQTLYTEYEVKRGLRNRDGSGVLAGLTQISSVTGSKIVDGDAIPEEGKLLYRGVPLDEVLSEFSENDRFAFEKIAFLLLVGDLPTPEELTEFSSFLSQERTLPDYVQDHIVKGIPSKNIMNKLQLGISSLYANDDTPDSLDPVENFIKAAKLIAKIPLIIAYSYLIAYKPGATLHTPSPDQSTAEAFLSILQEGKTPTQLEAHILDLALVLHAEHGGGNNSTFTTYVVTSSNSDIYSTLAAAVASLKGPLHGSANQKVMSMMSDIKAHVGDWSSEADVSNYITKIINKEAHDKSGKIFGLGHAVYTKSDPRATIIKEKAKSLAKEKSREDELGLYLKVEELGPKLFNEIKGSKKVIAPNVDFFSGFVYDCLNIPQEIYTPIFAMARVVGWAAHRIEETLSGKRIIRPGYKYVKTS